MKKLNKESLNNFLSGPIELLILDFDGVLTDNSVLIDESGMEYVRCTRADGIGLEKLVKIGVEVFILSTEVNNVVQQRAQKLNLKAYNGVRDKGEFIKNYLHKENINKKNVIFVGNDINDIPAFKEVGVSIGVADCSPDIENIIHFKTECKGGYGAVREICDILIEINGKQYGEI